MDSVSLNQHKQEQQQSKQLHPKETTSVTFVVESKKVQINELTHPLLQKFMELTDPKNIQDFSHIRKLKLEGNSYSRDICEYLGKVFARPQNNIQDLDINDIFVSRLKEEIPKSIQTMALGLKESHLQRLDISNNAVNPFGAKALLNFLETAKTLKTLIITNCGLGPLGVREISYGFKGMPNLEVLSIGRNRMENEGILYISEEIHHLVQLRELYIFQNTLRKEGLKPLFEKIGKFNVKLQTFDLCDNFVRDQATQYICLLIKELKYLKNLDLSDCLNETQNQLIIEAFENTENRSFEKLGFNFIELQADLAIRLLEVMKKCPLARLDIIGNDFPKKVKKAYDQVYSGKGILSKYDDDEDQQEEVTRLLGQLKL